MGVELLSPAVLAAARSRRYITRRDDASFDPGIYPGDEFPGLWREGLVEIASHAGVKPQFVGGLILAGYGAAVQATFKVQGSNEQLIGLSMNLLTIGRRGINETAATEVIFKFLRDYHESEINRRSVEIEEFLWRKKIYELERKAIEKAISKNFTLGRDTSELVKRLSVIKRQGPGLAEEVNVIIDGGSPSAIVDVMCKGTPVSLANISDIGQFVGSRSMGDLEIINMLSNGPAALSFNRKGKSFTLKNVALSQNYMIRPEFARKFIGKLRGIGQIGRPLVCDISEELTGGECYTEPLKVFPMLSLELLEILKSEMKKRSSQSFEYKILRTSPIADQVYNEYFSDLRESIKPGGYFSDVDDAVMNLKHNALKVAGIFHLMKKAEGFIDGETMKSALYVCSWYLQEFQRLFGRVGQISDDYVHARMLEDWLWARFAAKRHVYRVKFAEIQNMGPRALRSAVVLDRAKRILEKRGIIIINSHQDGEFFAFNRDYFCDAKIPARIAPMLKDFDYLHNPRSRYSLAGFINEAAGGIQSDNQ